MKSQTNSLLWTPGNKRIKNSQMYSFMQLINNSYSLKINNFNELHSWSVSHRDSFWEETLNFFKIKVDKGEKPFLDPENKMPGTSFFPKGKISYAENMLKKNNKEIAIIFNSEDKIKKKFPGKN